MNVINNSGNSEQAIRDMINTYPQLEKEILPQLRRAEVYTFEEYQEVVERKK